MLLYDFLLIIIGEAVNGLLDKMINLKIKIKNKDIILDLKIMQVLGDRAKVAAVHNYNPVHCHTNEKDSKTLRRKAEQKVKGIFQLQFINY